MTRVYFVRHAQPVHSHADDRTRPLTEEGIADTSVVLETLKDKQIDAFYCSPYKRSMDTIRSTAEYYGMEIATDERLRERENGENCKPPKRTHCPKQPYTTKSATAEKQ